MPRKFTAYPQDYIQASKFTDTVAKLANSYKPFLKTMSLQDIWDDVAATYDACIADLVIKQLQ